MSYQRSLDPNDPGQQPLCVHFRSKAMCVTGQRFPQAVDEQHSHDQNCWCNVTQHVKGPDHALTQLKDCTVGRDCYRAM